MKSNVKSVKRVKYERKRTSDGKRRLRDIEKRRAMKHEHRTDVAQAQHTTQLLPHNNNTLQQ